MKRVLHHVIALSLLIALGTSSLALAHEQGDWLIRFGASNVDPDSNNHPVVSVGDDTSYTFNFTYMMTDHWAVEVLAAWPFLHDINLIGGPKVGKTKHLPPTFSAQYHFLPASRFQPYVGAGLNYTKFFQETTQGPLAGSDLQLDDSWGLALEIGADIKINEKWFINLSYREIDIDTDATLDGADLGSVKIDPSVYGVHVGARF